MTSVSGRLLLRLFSGAINSPEFYEDRRRIPRQQLCLQFDDLLFRRHNVAIVKNHASRGVKIVSPTTGTHILYREINSALSDFKAQRQTGFPELIIEILRPIPEALRIEACHIGDEDFTDQAVYGFALLLAVGMHRGGQNSVPL